MTYKTLRYQRAGNVILVHVAESDRTLSELASMAMEYEDLFSWIRTDENIRGVVLSGDSGQPFSLSQFSSSEISCAHKEVRSIVEAIGQLDKPVVAGINGDAIGVGLELALACDLRIATETSRFGLPQVSTGVIPFHGGTQRLSRLVGKAKALEMILTGQEIDAYEAFRVGLINAIAPTDEILDAALGRAQNIASKAPLALRYVKEAVCKGMDLTLDQGLRLEADLYFLLHTTRDRTEGIKAFQEKRTAKFEGK